MEKILSVNLTIDGRKYPIKAKAHEEENLRKAERLINKRIEFHLRENKVYDRQDLFAMVLIEYVFGNLKLEDNNDKLLGDLSSKLKNIDDILNQVN
jgi:cell division protein ZapA (FtsZ GTPase activity inhibitor)